MHLKKVEFVLDWKRKKDVKCIITHGSFDTLRGAELECLNDASCSKVVDLHCKTMKRKEFRICSTPIQMVRWRGCCVYEKPGKYT